MYLCVKGVDVESFYDFFNLILEVFRKKRMTIHRWCGANDCSM